MQTDLQIWTPPENPTPFRTKEECQAAIDAAELPSNVAPVFVGPACSRCDGLKPYRWYASSLRRIVL